jgi:nucleotide-binding universal stress UspA family protein
MTTTNRIAAHCDFAQQLHPTQKQYGHILVPCGLNQTDISALTLGLEIATAHGARLTIVNVSPVRDDGPSMHWLDAIDRLYSALDNRSATTAGQSLNSPELAGKLLAQFVYQHVPEHFRSSLNLHCISLSGDAARMIARYINDSDVDLVIMSCRSPRWWQSALSPTVQRVMRLTQKQLLLVRSKTQQA